MSLFDQNFNFILILYFISDLISDTMGQFKRFEKLNQGTTIL